MADEAALQARYDAALEVVRAAHAAKAEADDVLKASRAACISANEAIVAAETQANRAKTALGLAQGWATEEVRELAVG